MASLRAMLKQIVKVPFSSLIVSGETGTGKGMIARILHYSGVRSHAPLVEINCAALPRELLEAELFGLLNWVLGSLLTGLFRAVTFPVAWLIGPLSYNFV